MTTVVSFLKIRGSQRRIEGRVHYLPIALHLQFYLIPEDLKGELKEASLSTIPFPGTTSTL
jgi:hypothetical protein